MSVSLEEVRRACWALTAAVSVISVSGWCQAQSSSSLAETLFQEGRALMKQGRVSEACPKFAASHEAEPSVGSLLNLASCHERESKTASAWSEYVKAASMARQANQPKRVKFAEERAKALEPKLKRVALQIPAAVKALPGLRLVLGQLELPPAAWDTATPVDPGEHELLVSASEHQSVRLRFKVGEAPTVTLELPLLAPAPKEKTSGPPKERVIVVRERVLQREPSALPWVVGGAGVAFLAVSAGLGARALTLNGNARDVCPTSPCKDAAAVEDSRSAVTTALVADIAGALGVLGVGAGVFLWWSQPKVEPSPKPSGASLELRLGSTRAAAGLSLEARF